MNKPFDGETDILVKDLLDGKDLIWPKKFYIVLILYNFKFIK